MDPVDFITTSSYSIPQLPEPLVDWWNLNAQPVVEDLLNHPVVSEIIDHPYTQKSIKYAHEASFFEWYVY